MPRAAEQDKPAAAHHAGAFLLPLPPLPPTLGPVGDPGDARAGSGGIGMSPGASWVPTPHSGGSVAEPPAGFAACLPPNPKLSRLTPKRCEVHAPPAPRSSWCHLLLSSSPSQEKPPSHQGQAQEVLGSSSPRPQRVRVLPASPSWFLAPKVAPSLRGDMAVPHQGPCGTPGPGPVDLLRGSSNFAMS